jgi:hypothetical protein
MIRQRSRASVVTRQIDFPFTVPPWRQAASCENGEKLFLVKEFTNFVYSCETATRT